MRNFVIFFWNLRNVHRYEISHSHSHAKVHYSQKIRKIIGNFTKLYSILYNFVKFYTIIWIFIQVYKCLCNYTKFRISHSHAKFLYNYSYLWIREKKIRFRTSLTLTDSEQKAEQTLVQFLNESGFWFVFVVVDVIV